MPFGPSRLGLVAAVESVTCLVSAEVGTDGADR
jgi:hypothetical protein